MSVCTETLHTKHGWNLYALKKGGEEAGGGRGIDQPNLLH